MVTLIWGAPCCVVKYKTLRYKPTFNGRINLSKRTQKSNNK